MSVAIREIGELTHPWNLCILLMRLGIEWAAWSEDVRPTKCGQCFTSSRFGKACRLEGFDKVFQYFDSDYVFALVALLLASRSHKPKVQGGT